MRVLYLLALVLPVVFYLLDSQLPKFYIFDPVRLQELSQQSIAAGQGNATTVLHNLVGALQQEYGVEHVNIIENDKWFFK